jgi:hypothetical protein
MTEIWAMAPDENDPSNGEIICEEFYKKGVSMYGYQKMRPQIFTEELKGVSLSWPSGIGSIVY